MTFAVYRVLFAQSTRHRQAPLGLLSHDMLLCLTPMHTDTYTYGKQVCVEVEGECFVAAAAGEHHTLVVNQFGDVYTFGRGREGQLGHGEASRLDTVDVPRKVKVKVVMVGVASASCPLLPLLTDVSCRWIRCCCW